MSIIIPKLLHCNIVVARCFAITLALMASVCLNGAKVSAGKRIYIAVRVEVSSGEKIYKIQDGLNLLRPMVAPPRHKSGASVSIPAGISRNSCFVVWEAIEGECLFSEGCTQKKTTIEDVYADEIRSMIAEYFRSGNVYSIRVFIADPEREVLVLGFPPKEIQVVAKRDAPNAILELEKNNVQAVASRDSSKKWSLDSPRRIRKNLVNNIDLSELELVWSIDYAH